MMSSLAQRLRATRIDARGSRVLIAALVVLVAAAAAATFLVLRDDGLPEGTAVEVNGHQVTEAEVENRMQAIQALYGVPKPKAEDKRDTFRRDTTKSIAVQMVLAEAAEDRDIVIAKKVVNDALATLVARGYPNGGRTAFVQALGRLGASEKQVTDEIEQQVLVARLYEDVTRDVAVTDEELESAFRERREELAGPEQRQLRNVVVSTRRDANRVLQALRAGVSFAELARRTSLDASSRSAGGSLGLVTRSSLEKDYGTAAFSAEVGVPFGPVQTEHGWNVGLVERKVVPEPPTFRAAAARLRTILVQEKSVEIWTEWLRDLLEEAEIEYAEDYEPADPDGVPELGADLTAAGS